LIIASNDERKTATKEKSGDSEKEVEDSLVLSNENITNTVLSLVVLLNQWSKSALIHSFHALAQNPETQEKLSKEIGEVNKSQEVG